MWETYRFPRPIDIRQLHLARVPFQEDEIQVTHLDAEFHGGLVDVRHCQIIKARHQMGGSAITRTQLERVISSRKEDEKLLRCCNTKRRGSVRTMTSKSL
jgi:hypothetical protein